MAGSFLRRAGAISHSGQAPKRATAFTGQERRAEKQQARDLYLFRGVMVGHVLMFDWKRSIVGSHFPVVLPGYRIGRFFCSLLEHASALGEFLCICHLTPHAEQEFSECDTRSRPLGRQISIDRMSYKNTGAKQSQDCRDRFDHFYAPCCTTGTSGSPRWFQDRFINST
jgi:hypothetical protein